MVDGNMFVSERADAIPFIYQFGHNLQQYYMNSTQIGCCLVEAVLLFSFIYEWVQREKRWGLRKTKGEVNTGITTTTTTTTIITFLVHTKNSWQAFAGNLRTLC